MYRMVRLPWPVETDARLRVMSLGLAGKQCGAVLRQVRFRDGVVALVCLNRENAPLDAEGEVVVEHVVGLPPLPRLPEPNGNIFDFT